MIGDWSMYVRSVSVSLTFKLLLVLAGLAGLLLVFGVFDGAFEGSVLHYFTILSNLLCVLYFIADLAYMMKNRGGSETALCPALKGIATMGVTVTCLVAHFILKRSFNFTTTGGVSEFLLHYAVPIMTVADWLLFDRKGYMKVYSPLLWTIAPMAYFAYAMIAARVGEGIGYGGSRYPYPFMDVDKLGWGTVLLTVLVLLAIFIALGYVYVLIDRVLLKARQKETVR
jgi:hypothetical protein